ncbi:MAG: PQQ-dependent sugar dehydrogenase [Bacteroidota bacterium]
MNSPSFLPTSARWIFLLGVSMAFLTACQPEPAQVDDPKALTSDADNGTLNLPDGFGAIVVADTIGRARHIAVRDNGDIYVKLRKLQNGHGILALRDTDGDGRIDQTDGFGEFTGTGIAIHDGYLYATSDSSVYRYELVEGQLLPKLPGQLMVGGFPIQGQHAAKPLTFDGMDNMYVNIGAPSNACQEEMRTKGSPGLDPCPQLDRQAGIWRFSASQPGQTQIADGHRYATGIRNAMALDWNAEVNSLFVVQHGRDDLDRLFPEHFTTEERLELPAEEFLQVSDGDDFGWPYCYFDGFTDKKTLAPEYGGDGEKQGRCEGMKAPIESFPAHLAPNDLLFYNGDMFPEKYKKGAFIAFHGSWNRAPAEQQGYFVVFVPLLNGIPSGEWEVFASGFPNLEEVKSPRDAVYRPTGLAQGPDGSLYITDSVKGRIWRVVYDGHV